ncbi:hypothetical protein QVD17_26692 [Tagetes erecta]|uniref:Phytosulfokine n=1 Tax=Tagetes erecta TaxID=13708 RepID=A0AAD8K9I7_TARER|nr:hypothetical protein QVD17_26692 [Tagetes erecta]
MATILFLPMLSYTIARPDLMFNDATALQIDHMDEAVAKVKDVKNCSGPEIEECLTRTTLDAHLDYIYTNDDHL